MYFVKKNKLNKETFGENLLIGYGNWSRETNKTNRISKSYFVFHFFNNKREERPSILILHFCIFLASMSAV
jgi:hypothetical protein